MNSRDRERLRQALGDDLPPGFSFEEWDSFINYTPDGRSLRSCRVVRLVDPGRMLVLFDYNDLVPEGYWPGRRYRLCYLNNRNDLIVFDSDAVVAAWKAENDKDPNDPYSWDKVIGAWLEANGARQFKGRGWAVDCAMKVLNLCRRWEKHYSGIPSST
jgi:hypothetical protein